MAVGDKVDCALSISSCSDSFCKSPDMGSFVNTGFEFSEACANVGVASKEAAVDDLADEDFI